MKQNKLQSAISHYIFNHIWLVILASLVIFPAHATTTYSYTGNNFTNISDTIGLDGSYDTSMNLSGYFSVNSALTTNSGEDFGPLLPGMRNVTSLVSNYSFFDGRQTLNQSNSSLGDVAVKIDNVGNLVEWAFNASWSAPTPLNNSDIGEIISRSFLIRNTPSSPFFGTSLDAVQIASCIGPIDMFGFCTDANNEDASVISNPGSWTSDIAVVPVPAAAWLFGSGLITLIGFSNRKPYKQI